MHRFVPSSPHAELSPCPWTLRILILLCLTGLFVGGCAVDLRGGDQPTDDADEETDDDDENTPITPTDDDDDDDAATDDDDAATDDDDDDDTPPVVNFEPLAGDWVIITAQLTLDECGLEGFMDRGQPGSIFELDNTGESAFDLTFGGDEAQTSGGGEVLPCTLDESTLAYECGNSLSERDLNEEFGLNAVIPVDMSAWGEFSTATTGTLTTQVDLTCVGDNCGLVGILLGTSFPCTMVNSTEVEPST